MAECRRCLDLALERVDNGYFEVVMLTVVDSEATWAGWARRHRPERPRSAVGS